MNLTQEGMDRYIKDKLGDDHRLECNRGVWCVYRGETRLFGALLLWDVREKVNQLLEQEIER